MIICTAFSTTASSCSTILVGETGNKDKECAGDMEDSRNYDTSGKREIPSMKKLFRVS